MHALIAALALGLAVASSAQGAVAPKVDTLATLPAGASLQAIDIAPDGALYVTVYSNNEVVRISPDGRVSTLAKLPIRPQGVLATRDGFIVSGHASGPASNTAWTMVQRFYDVGGQVLLLDRAGAVVKAIPTGPNSFPNGMTRLSETEVLVADTLGGVIWRVDLTAGTLSTWLQDPLLQPDPAFPGANGVKIHGDWVYVSHTSKGQLLRAPLGADRKPSGPLAVYAGPAPRNDDFSIARDGTIYVSNHAAMIRVAPGGEVSRVFESVPGGSSLMLAPDQKSIYVLTDPPALEGGARGPAKVLRLWLD